MKFLAIAALAGSAAAGIMGTGSHSVEYTTETKTYYTTYCPHPTTMTYGTHTYTVTEPTHITITDCPDKGCTVVRPVYTKTHVDCPGHCNGYGNGTTVHPTGTYYPTGTTTHIPPTKTDEPPVATAGAGKVVGLSGAAFAGVLALAAAL